MTDKAKIEAIYNLSGLLKQATGRDEQMVWVYAIHNLVGELIQQDTDERLKGLPVNVAASVTAMLPAAKEQTT